MKPSNFNSSTAEKHCRVCTISCRVQHRVSPTRQRLQYRETLEDSLEIVTTIARGRTAKFFISKHNTWSYDYCTSWNSSHNLRRKSKTSSYDLRTSWNRSSYWPRVQTLRHMTLVRRWTVEHIRQSTRLLSKWAEQVLELHSRTNLRKSNSPIPTSASHKTTCH